MLFGGLEEAMRGGQNWPKLSLYGPGHVRFSIYSNEQPRKVYRDPLSGVFVTALLENNENHRKCRHRLHRSIIKDIYLVWS